MKTVSLSPFTEAEYHRFFRKYVPDPAMTMAPYQYNRELISNSYRYNYGGFQKGYAHYGVFLDGVPVGAFQLKRINDEQHICEFGIILQNDRYKDRGIGTEALILGLEIARTQYHIDYIFGDTAGRNNRMKRVFEKTGFELIETVPNAFELPDGRYDSRLIWKKRLKDDGDDA